MYCGNCESNPCTCMNARSTSDWLIQTCSTLGCDVVIRARLGKQDAVPVCKWCLNHTSHAMNGKPNIDRKIPTLQQRRQA